jgi:hypothetical protein
MLNEGNYGSGSDFLTSYGSTRQKVTVPVPQHCFHEVYYIQYRRSIKGTAVKIYSGTGSLTTMKGKVLSPSLSLPSSSMLNAFRTAAKRSVVEP